MVINFELIKRGLSFAGKYAKIGCAFVLPVIGAALADKGVDYLAKKIYNSGKVTYNDAVDAILNGDMLSSAKQESVKILKKDGDSEYYRCIIHTVQSSLLSNAKYNIIETLSRSNEDSEVAQA